jgi:butyrate kinase
MVDHLDSKIFKILVVNPGSTGVKVSIFENESEKITGKISFDYDAARKDDNKVVNDIAIKITKWAGDNNYDCKSLDAIASRAGLLCPVPSGVYKIDQDVIDDLNKKLMGWHASNLGPLVSHIIAKQNNLDAYLMDPVTVDELEHIARITGLPDVRRRSVFHALNQKAVARRACMEKGLNYQDVNLIVAHLGSGITVGAHKKGRVIDVNNGLVGEGPFSTERCNDIPNCDLIDMCFSGKYTRDQVNTLISSNGGLYAYFNTKDIARVRRMEEEGNKEAKNVLAALAYQVSKEICKNSAVLMGDIDAVILTGGLAFDDVLITDIKERVSFLGPVWNYPGEEEMLALCEGGLSVLRKEREAYRYADFSSRNTGDHL